MLIKVEKTFQFSQDTLHVDDFTPGDEPVEVTDLCGKFAVKHGYAKEVKGNAGKTTDTKGDDEKAADSDGDKPAADTKGGKKAAKK